MWGRNCGGWPPGAQVCTRFGRRGLLVDHADLHAQTRVVENLFKLKGIGVFAPQGRGGFSKADDPEFALLGERGPIAAVLEVEKDTPCCAQFDLKKEQREADAEEDSGCPRARGGGVSRRCCVTHDVAHRCAMLTCRAGATRAGGSGRGGSPSWPRRSAPAPNSPCRSWRSSGTPGRA